MQISGRDIEEAKRERLLIDDDEIFELREVALSRGQKYRCFQLYQGDTNIGQVYEDQIDPDVLRRLE